MTHDEQHQKQPEEHGGQRTGPGLRTSAPAGPDRLTEGVRSGEISRVFLAVPDMQGRLKGKILDAPIFVERMRSEAQMCAYILATDLDMTPLGDFDLTGWAQGYGDLGVKRDPRSLRMLPHQAGTALVIGDAFHHDGTPVEVAPRHMLRTQLERLSDLGYHVALLVESEFLLLAGTPEDARDAGYRDLRPAWPHNLDYALGHPPKTAGFFRDLHDALQRASIPVEAIKTEGAPGQAEVTFAYGEAMAACDAHPAFRLIVDDLAHRQGMTPVWMAAPYAGIGSGLHLHLSLWSNNGNAFAYHRGRDLPPAMERAVAGLISAMPHLAPLYAPTPNSYKRYRPHSFAPSRHTWGFDNRGCAVRVTGTGEGAHLEIRWPGADANPYLALAAVCAAIVHGLQDDPELPEPCEGDPYTALAVQAPADLIEALAYFNGSKIAEGALGESVVRHYTRAARAEIAWQRTQVTDAERERGIGRA
ncbi:glutamine synthetase family protein [Streptomyces acidiscabies]|uniref:glutamine synthetase family protein n=1 Tax=Streptomyces acidiscabies TaxID=42234 RepID=UPI0009A0D280|nr:glutamine synthetase family protein [Streptomyces acidiscabies]